MSNKSGGTHYPLFEHLSKHYNLTLLEGELQDIIDVVISMQKPELPANCLDPHAWFESDLNQLPLTIEFDETNGSSDNLMRGYADYVMALRGGGKCY